MWESVAGLPPLSSQRGVDTVHTYVCFHTLGASQSWTFSRSSSNDDRGRSQHAWANGFFVMEEAWDA